MRIEKEYRDKKQTITGDFAAMIANGKRFQETDEGGKVEKQFNQICTLKSTLRKRLGIFGVAREDDFVYFSICKNKNLAEKCQKANKLKQQIHNQMRSVSQGIEIKNFRLVSTKTFSTKDLKQNEHVKWEKIAQYVQDPVLLNWLSKFAKGRRIILSVKPNILLLFERSELTQIDSSHRLDDERIDTYMLMIKKENNTDLNTQNSVLKQAKFVIDQIRFYKDKECQHLLCVDIGCYKDCIKKFNDLINIEYEKVVENSTSLTALAGEFKLTDSNNCNDETLDEICSNTTADLDLLQNRVKALCKTDLSDDEKLPQNVEQELCSGMENDEFMAVNLLNEMDKMSKKCTNSIDHSSCLDLKNAKNL